MPYDLKNQLSVAVSAAHDRQGAAANGAAVDLRGFESAVAVLAVAALSAGASATYRLQDSADNITWADVAAADLDGSQPAAFTGAGQAVLGYRGTKRYLRWRLDSLTGATPTVTAVGLVIRGHPRYAPPA